MGGIGLWLQTTSTEHLTHLYAHIHRYKIRTYTHIHLNNTDTYIRTQLAHNMHTICTQFAHTHRHNNKTICSTQNRTQIHRHRTLAQPQRTEHSTYDLHIYSFDYYFEYAYIKNSNTIELYTISKENI